MKHKFLCLKEAYSMCYSIEDLTILLLLLPYFMCFDNTGDHMIMTYYSNDKAV